jgi:hypothetical protein
MQATACKITRTLSFSIVSGKKPKNICNLQENIGNPAPEKKEWKKLIPVITKSINPFRKSSNRMKKKCQIVAKGHNVTYEIANSLKHTRTATDVKDGHVSENRGARDSPHFLALLSQDSPIDQIGLFIAYFRLLHLCEQRLFSH